MNTQNEPFPKSRVSPGSARLTKSQQKRRAIAKIITIIREWQIDGTDDVEHAEGMRAITTLQARSRKLSQPNTKTRRGAKENEVVRVVSETRLPSGRWGKRTVINYQASL